MNFAQFCIVGSVGRNFANGFYSQIDLRFQKTDVPSYTDDTLHDGGLIAFRAGKDFGSYQLGGFVGYVDVTADDSVGNNEMQRVVFGLDGAYSITPELSVFGELGGIGGHKGTQGTNGDDGIHDATYAIAGLSYDVSPAFSLVGQFGFANGTHDTDELDIELAGIGVYYQTKVQGLSAYLRADYADYYQHGEDEGLASTTVQLGIVYAFGGNSNSSKRLRPLAQYEDWLGYSGGHLE
ncbi:MAG: hypothetical protein HRU33_10890 [Rhodobacteraceae bacterium]|nr:hypothetical protein [Paracoccaceae bacterium]